MAGPAPAPKLPRRLNFSGARDQPALSVRITEFQDDVIEYLRVLDLPNALRDLEELIEEGAGALDADGVQDAIGNILVDSSTIDFTYDALTPEITAEVIDGSITNAKLADMATARFKGRTTAGSGPPEDLTATQATALLNVAGGDSGSGGIKGLVPAPAAGDAAADRWLHADMTWKAGNLSVAHYTGTNTADIDFTATTWSGIHNVLTLTDAAASGVSRSNSDFTFTLEGRYRVFITTLHVSTGAGQRLGFRARLGSTTVALAAHTYADVDTKANAFVAILDFTVTAGQTVSLQYCVSASTAGTVTGTTLNGETMPTLTIHIERL